MSFHYRECANDVGHEAGAQAAIATHRDAISNAERYEWIRAHRGDFAITRALECSDFDPDFDRQIDAAIYSSRMGGLSPTVTAWWDAPGGVQRRRSDDADE